MKYSKLIVPALYLYAGFYIYRSLTGVGEKLNPDRRDNFIYNLVPESWGDWWYEINNRPRPEMGSEELDKAYGKTFPTSEWSNATHTMPDGSTMAGATHDGQNGGINPNGMYS